MSSKLLKYVVLLNIVTNGMSLELCDVDKVDNVFTKQVYLTDDSHRHSKISVVIENNKLYVWDSLTQSMGKPIEEEKERKTLTKIHIKGHQDCKEVDIQCKEMKKIKNMIITFYRNQVNGQHQYVLSLVNKNTHTEYQDVRKEDLPWNQSHIGDPTIFSQFNLWPEEWVTQPHASAAYSDSSKEIIYIMNPNNSTNTTTLFSIAINPYDYPFNESVLFTVQTLDFSHQFVGLFNYEAGPDLKKIYAITEDMRLLEMKADKTFEETNVNLKQLIGCIAPEEPSFNWLIIIIILIVVVIVIIIFGLILLAWKKVFVPNYYKTPTMKEGVPSITQRTEGQTELISIVTVNSQTGEPVRDQ